MARKLLKCIGERKIEIFKSPVILAGWYLDNRMMPLMLEENDGFRSMESAKEVIRVVSQKLDKLDGVAAIESVRDQNDEVEIAEKESGNRSTTNLFEKRLMELQNKRESIKVPSQKERLSRKQILEQEIKLYELMPMRGQTVKIIDWWISKVDELPMMSNAALNIISAPVTEVTTERLFSDLNLIMTKSRSCLKGQLLSDILFLRLNKKFNV